MSSRFFQTFARLSQFAEKVKWRRIFLELFFLRTPIKFRKRKPQLRQKQGNFLIRKQSLEYTMLLLVCWLCFLCEWWPKIGVLRHEVQVYQGHAILFSFYRELNFPFF